MLYKKQFIENLGCKVRKIRTEKKISIEKLSNKSGISYSQLIRIEKGKINTSIYQLYQIACNLEVKIEDFLED